MNLENLRKLDCFSPEITLYFKKRTQHSSICSGILALSYYTSVLVITVIYSYKLFIRKKPTSSFVKEFIEDPGVYEVNSTNFKHYIALSGSEKIDTRAIEVIGVQMKPSEIMSAEGEISINFWGYSYCDENKEKEYLCISRFHNITEQKNYSINEVNFSYPLILHGTGNDNSSPYTIIIKRCQNTSTSTHCYSDEIIDDAIENFLSFRISFNDRYVNVDHFEEPFIEHLNSFEFGMIRNGIASNSINFNPTIVKTHQGLFYDIVKEETSYTFEQVIRGNYERKGTPILGIICLWMQNQVNVYDRVYLDLPNILTNITAISRVVWCLCYFVNYFVNKYVVYDDFGYLYEKKFFKIFKPKGLQIKHVDVEVSQKKTVNKFRKRNSEISNYSFLKLKEYSMNKLLLYYFRCKSNPFIDALMDIRGKALAEEKLIKYYLMFSNIGCWDLNESKNGNKNFFHTFNDDIKSRQLDKSDINNSRMDFIKRQNYITYEFRSKTKD